MKCFKKLLVLLLALSLSFSLFACGGGGDDDDDDDEVCVEHIDDNEDGKCDECNADMPTSSIQDLILIDNGEAKFQFVLEAGLPIEVSKLIEDSIISVLEDDCDIYIDIVDEDEEDSEQDVEILIGSVTTRGEEYEFDRYSLGKEGYIFKIVGNKVLINAGSDETLLSAIEEFAEDVLDISGNPFDVTMTKAYAVTLAAADIQLMDHVLVSPGGMKSMFAEGKLDHIERLPGSFSLMENYLHEDIAPDEEE